MLTLQQLKDMKPGTIFASGEIENSLDGLYMTDSDKGKMLVWAAKRGVIEDWAIYTHWAENKIDYAIRHGDKVTSPVNIKKLVPCEPDAFKMYRF